MGMKDMPEIIRYDDGSAAWEHEFDSFKVKVYVPKTELMADIINYDFIAPYLMVFEENERTLDEARTFAEETGLSKIASANAGSVAFFYPNSKKDNPWEDLDDGFFEDIIANSKVHQYYTDGIVTFRDRFTKERKDNFIRGAIFRTVLYGYGKSADYIATHLLKTINGEGLWGPADVTPTVCVLENLSVTPVIERDDIPVVSIKNPDDINDEIFSKVKSGLIKDEAEYVKDYNEFISNYRRWVGVLAEEVKLKDIDMTMEPGVFTLKTSKDNEGDDANSEYHKVGYLAYYNNGIMDKKKVPLVLIFHGGGDSAMRMADTSGWWRVAHDHDFLLVSVENHLNSTATEMMEFIDKLKDKYNIDPTRIYASGFSMGGCKSWDMYQEYPEVFAGLAPMDATFEVGLNVFGKEAPVKINEDVLVPIFYAGGEITPLPELPFQAQKCLDRMAYVFKVNRIKKEYSVNPEDKDSWVNPIWGIDGDETEILKDEERDGILTMQKFISDDGRIYSVFASIDNQGHDVRHHTCENAYRFLKKFRRLEDGTLTEED